MKRFVILGIVFGIQSFTLQAASPFHEFDSYCDSSESDLDSSEEEKEELTKEELNRKFIKASKAGHKDVAIGFLKLGADINATDNSGNAAICYVAFSGDEEFFNTLLIDWKTDPKVLCKSPFRDGDEDLSLLHIAAGIAHVNMMKRIVMPSLSSKERDNNVLLKLTKYGRTPLDIIIEARHRWDKSELQVQNHSYSEIAELWMEYLSQHSSPFLRGKYNLISVIKRKCETTNDKLIQYSDLQFMLNLIKERKNHKVIINHQDADGNTIAHHAVKTANEHLVRLVCDFAPDLHLRNSQGRTVFDILDDELCNGFDNREMCSLVRAYGRVIPCFVSQ